MSMYRASTTSASAVVFPGAAEASALGQDQSVGVSGPRIEPLEPCCHPLRREPSHQRVRVQQGVVTWAGGARRSPVRGVRAGHALNRRGWTWRRGDAGPAPTTSAEMVAPPSAVFADPTRCVSAV